VVLLAIPSAFVVDVPPTFVISDGARVVVGVAALYAAFVVGCPAGTVFDTAFVVASVAGGSEHGAVALMVEKLSCSAEMAHAPLSSLQPYLQCPTQSKLVGPLHVVQAVEQSRQRPTDFSRNWLDAQLLLAV